MTKKRECSGARTVEEINMSKHTGVLNDRDHRA